MNLQQIYVPAGKYILAVSGGVDSMVLLDILAKQPGLELIVAHFDHGIRKDSQQDRKLVQHVAMSHNIIFEFAEGKLGATANEAIARRVRYNFLQRIRKKYDAQAIITAHHQDDLLETAIINLLRGTGRKGLSSLQSTSVYIRPLLEVPKSEIIMYAIEHGLEWHEDSTNQDLAYLRNYVRNVIMQKFSKQSQKNLLQIIVRQRQLNDQIDSELDVWLQQHAEQSTNATSLPCYQLIMLPASVAYELLQRILRHLSDNTLERQVVERALLFCKTAKSGKIYELHKKWQIRITQESRVIVEARSS